MPNMHEADALDPDPSFGKYAVDVLCEHGDIQPKSKSYRGINAAVSCTFSSAKNCINPPSSIFSPEAAYTLFHFLLRCSKVAGILKTIFPDWEPVSAARLRCDICANLHTSTKESIAETKALATKEKVRVIFLRKIHGICS